MNYWTPNTMPYSWCEKGVTRKWQGNDKLQSMLTNPDLALWRNVPIEYRLNSHGFRTYELDSLLGQPVDVALGCSFTKGIGLPESARWSNLIELTRPYPMLNLGIGGGSSDTVARILTNISGLYNIQTVFVLWPLIERFEVYNFNTVDWILPQSAKTHHTWNMEYCQSINRFQKNQAIAHMLSTIYKFSVVELKLEEMLEILPKEFARDGMHFGITPNRMLSDMFISQLTV